MTKINNIAKNTSYLTLALVLQKIISLSYFTILARYLGPASLGKYYLAISLTTIFSIFIDLGFANVLTREIAKHKERASKLLGNVLVIKVPLAIITIIALTLFINILHYSPLIIFLVYISAISMVLDSFTVTFFSVARGFHNLKYESIAAIVFQLIVFIFGLIFLKANKGLICLMLALTFGSIYNFIYSFLIIKKRIKIKIKLLYKIQVIKHLFVIAWPFAIYAIFQRLYTYLDSVLLSILADNKQVGLYQISFKIIFALQFIPLAFTASLYPAMSLYWKNDHRQLAVSFKRALNYLIIISVPIVFGVIVLANKIILLFKSGFEGAVLPLQISIIALFFIFLNFPVGSLLNACDKQRRNTFNMVIATVVAVILNIIIIPRWQAVGASITVVIANLLIFILGIYWTKKIIVYKTREVWLVFFKSVISALIMLILILIGKNNINIFILSIISAIIYFTILYILGGFKKEDVMSVWQSLRK